MEKLREALLHATKDNIRNMERVLLHMDRDRDNVLSLEEFTKGFETLKLKMTAAEVAEIFNKLDKDKSGSLDLKEFLVALWGESSLSDAKQAAIGDLFKKLDKDNNGEINANDLKDGFAAKLSGFESNEEAIAQLMVVFDRNKDGKISYGELRNGFEEITPLVELCDADFAAYLKSAFKL